MLTATKYGPNDMRWDGQWPVTTVFEDELWCEWASACSKNDEGEDIVDELASLHIVEALDKAPVSHF